MSWTPKFTAQLTSLLNGHSSYTLAILAQSSNFKSLTGTFNAGMPLLISSGIRFVAPAARPLDGQGSQSESAQRPPNELYSDSRDRLRPGLSFRNKHASCDVFENFVILDRSIRMWRDLDRREQSRVPSRSMEMAIDRRQPRHERKTLDFTDRRHQHC